MEIDFYVTGDSAVLQLNNCDLEKDTILRIHNDVLNPAERIFLKEPQQLNTTIFTDWQSIIELAEGPNPEMIILLNSNTHIYQGNFNDFPRVLIIDHKISEENSRSVVLNNEQNYNAKLIIDNFKTKEGYLICSDLKLLGSGKIEKILGVKLHNSRGEFSIEGRNHPNYFYAKLLDIKSPLNSLFLQKITINNLNCDQIKTLTTNETIITDEWTTKQINDIQKLDLATQTHNSQIYCEKILVTNLLSTRGKFYISAKSYINFKIENDGYLRGIDLILDMSASTLAQKKINFPAHSFNFDRMIVKGASEVSITKGGTAREIMFEECDKVIAFDVMANSIKYTSKSKTSSDFYYSGKVAGDLILLGQVNITFYKIEIDNIEAYGLCNVNFKEKAKCNILKVNLNLDAANPNNFIQASQSAIRIINEKNEATEINNIIAKISNFFVKGNVKLGTVLIQTIDKIETLLWVDIGPNTKLSLDRLFLGFDHDLVLSKDGTISVIKTNNRALPSGDTFISGSASSKDYFHVRAGKTIRFDGKLHVVEGDISFFSKYGDIFVSGALHARNSIALISNQGAVSTNQATLQAKAIAIYSSTENYLAESILKAQEIVIYSLNHNIQTNDVKLEACNIVIVGARDIGISSTQTKSNQLTIKSGNNVNIQNSEVISYSLFVQSVHNFLLAKTSIDLVQYNHVLFANQTSKTMEGIIQGGYRVATDITLVGIFSPDKDQPLPKLSWQYVDFREQNILLKPASAYIDTGKGYIIGASLNAKDSVIIKTSHSLEVVPLNLYNEVMSAGGIKEQSIKEVVSRINAGLIDIEASKAASFVGAMLKAASGNVRAEILHVLNSPKEIKNQQGRIKELQDWGLGGRLIEVNKVEVGRYFDFSKSTSIAQRIGNLGVYDNFVSQDLSFTALGGDIILDRSLTKYSKLHLNAEKGKILIVSKNLQNIYRGFGGGEAGRAAAYASRTVIGGEHVYLLAEQIEAYGAKFAVKGDLKIIAKDGVHLLPVSVHERLMYHWGSKTRIEESIVRKVISEIDAGYLDIKAGGVLETVATLIQATGVNINVGELKLKAEYETFEKQVHFTGKKKWYGKRNSSLDVYYDALVLPTVINTNNLFVKVDRDATFEAAQILAKEESVMQAGGNIHLLHKHDIHVHDHTAKKTYLFKFNKGKMTVAGTKTVKEHFYGEEVAPTIYYSGGSFFGYSDGQIHLLGAKVLANDIYLVGKKGVKLQAAPYQKQTLVTISETGLRVGYNTSSGEHSVSAELFKNTDKLSQVAMLYEAAEVSAKGQLIISSEQGNLEVISSKMRFNKAQVKVKGIHIDTKDNQVTQQHTSTRMSLGIHVGVQENISSAINRVGYLINKSGTHWLDVLDRALNAYQLYSEIGPIIGDIANLADAFSSGNFMEQAKNLASVKFGVWARASVATSGNSSNNSVAVDNVIEGGDIDIQVDGQAIIKGIICSVDNFKIKANSLEVRASHNSSSREQYSGEISLTIPMQGNVSGGVNVSGSMGSSSATIYHANNMILAKGQLIVDIDGNALVSGVRLQGAEVLVRAQNLVVESLQDVIKERMQSLELNIGSGMLNSGAGSLGGKAQVQNRDAAWSNAIGSIVGTQVANIVVQQTLEIAGGMIANAEVDESGKLTDKGKAYVEAGSIVVKTLHDYDNGKSFGLGVSLSKKTAEDGNTKYGVGMPVVYGFDDQARDILPTIGSGQIKVAVNNSTSGSSNNSNNSTNIPGLNRNIHNHVGQTEGERANLKASIPISDIWEGLTTLSKPKEAPSAGDQPMSFGDYVEAFFNKIISPFVKEKEPETKIEIKNKLSSLDEQILVNISKDSEKAPVINNATDRETLNNIKAEVESKYPDVNALEKEKLINLSYNLLKNFQSGVYTPPPMQVAAAALTPGMFSPTVASAVAMAGTALVTIGEVAVAVAAANPVTVGAVVAGVGGYYLYDAFLKNDKAQEYNQLHTKLANGDYLSSAEDNSNYDINNNDDRIGIFDKKKHGNVDPKLKAKFKEASVQSATGMPDPDEEGPEDKESKETIENKEFKTKNFEKDDNIGLHRFTDRFEKTKFRDPKTGQYIEPDVGRNSGVRGHGGSYWKLYDKKDKLIGTITKDGRWKRTRN